MTMSYSARKFSRIANRTTTDFLTEVVAFYDFVNTSMAMKGELSHTTNKALYVQSIVMTALQSSRSAGIVDANAQRLALP